MYTLSDFIPYDALTWRSLYAQYLAQEVWIVLAMSLALLVATVFVLLNGRAGQSGRYCLVVLAIVWVWLAIRFHGLWHQQLNWAAYFWKWAFLCEAVLLILFLALRSDEQLRPQWPTALLALPWVVPPIAGWYLGNRPPGMLEFVGAAPDPTAWFTLLIAVLMFKPVVASVLMIVPLLSLLFSLAAAWVTQANELIVVHAVSIVSLLAICIVRKRHGTVGRR